MAPEIFLDTGGIYAALVKRDAAHHKAAGLLQQARSEGWRFITTDYVLDEAATLFKMRGQQQLCRTVFNSTARAPVRCFGRMQTGLSARKNSFCATTTMAIRSPIALVS